MSGPGSHKQETEDLCFEHGWSNPRMCVLNPVSTEKSSLWDKLSMDAKQLDSLKMWDTNKERPTRMPLMALSDDPCSK